MKWQKIIGFEKYEVSENGDIRSVDRVVPAYTDSLNRNFPERLLKGRIRKMREHELGYLMCELVSNDGQSVHEMTAHRAIALGFKGKPPFDNAVARHLDGNVKNNRESNIAWGMQSDNMADAVMHGTVQKGESRYNARLKEEDVVEIRLRAISGETFISIATDFGISKSICYRIAIGEKWACVDSPLYEKKTNKLSPYIRVEVKARLDSGESMKPLAREYGVSVTQIRNIRDSK